MASGLSQEVESMRREQRRYKQLQRRAAGSMEVYSTTTDLFSLSAGGSITAWIDGVNTRTLIASGSSTFTYPEPIVQPIYDATNDRCGFKIYSPLAATTWNVVVFANQEFTLNVES